MFNNIGKKIKGLCKIAFYVLAGCAIVGGVIVFISPFLTSNNPDVGQIVGCFFLMLVVSALGIFLSWLLVMILYAFSEVVDSNQIQVRQNKKIISILSGKDTDSEEDNDLSSSVKFFTNENNNIIDNVRK